MIQPGRQRLRVLWLGLALLGGCGPASPPTEVRPVGGVGIVCEPTDALLFVDDRYVGTVAGLRGRPITLLEGPHRIELRRDGYFAHYADVTVVKGVRQRLQVVLRRELF